MIQINNMLKFATKHTHSKSNKMSKFGFSKDWIDKIMNCIKHVDFSVLVNGCLSKAFYP